ncbi:MAG: lysophospholipid acyltransferase family protein [Pseudomonadota bacterium]|jgi:1-acyl-sn-glycerol-3-phosphate acyltransferase
MIRLRSALFALGLMVLAVAAPLVPVASRLVFPRDAIARYRLTARWAGTVLAWLEATCGLRYRVIGAENIPAAASVILSKHQSAWETLAFQKIFPPQVWVLKRELLRVPFFGWALAMTRPIAIDRSAGKEALRQLVAQGKDRLEQGFSVVVFPEGTRVAPGEKGKYNIGGAWLATHTGALVVPVAHNAGEFWGRNAFLKRPGTITVSIGKPIDPAGMKPAELNAKAEEWIEGEMRRISGQEAGYRASLATNGTNVRE